MLVLNIMGSPWINQLNAINISFQNVWMYHYSDVLLLVILYLSFCNCSFLCKKNCFIYHSCSTHHILNVLANSENKLHQILYFPNILSLLDDFSTNSFMAVLIYNLSVRSLCIWSNIR